MLRRSLAVRCRRGSSPRPSAPLGNDRNGAADAVGDIRHLIVGVDRHAARFFANADLGQLIADVVALIVFHLND